MSPTTPLYLIYIAVSAVIYYLVPAKLQNLFLLVSSLVFYMWAAPAYVVFIGATIGVCYAAGLMMERYDEKKRKIILTGTLLILVGVLFFFKYFGFFTQVVSDIASLFGGAVAVSALKLAAPLGISFYTFQVIGYLVDICNGKFKAEKCFINFALFVSFFPAIISGPIGRSGELLPQYGSYRKFSYSTVVEGMQRFLTGAFRKMVLADGIGIIVDSVIDSPSSYGSLTVFIAVVLYNIKIYCDFAGYSEMAVGAAKVFGIKVRENFNVPFLATDMAGFWKRWHMSLTTWLQDYIFTPLVWSRWANKVCFGKRWEEHKPVVLINIVIVFLVSGIWHGAAYGYIVWGLLHGFFRVAEEAINKYRKKHKIKKKKGTIYTWLGRAKVFLIAGFTHMFFTLKAGEIIPALAHSYSPSSSFAEIMYLASNEIASGGIYILLYFGILAVGFALMAAGDFRIEKTGNLNPVSTLPERSRWAVYWFMGFSICWFYMIAATGAAGTASFIYAGF